ncbi:ABC transporter permease [Jannaschia rubra]|uniref:Ribose transport system permease protein RbsC n=1 Tax=Jannaschia rubra TaxID=282197 RepID=A0A0M6XRL6_9RHOB|nr:ABC transporter permease [Jannaschia rubra]CTQ33267.1 Ribose transport system permease protein RbsC [Jannaschia rubra]SFF98123.1 mannose ABC transporter membrane protein /fructose ABC transporter membrane protein /ribose ABC transporter membrane protein [Jannaschia rubra]
MPSDITHATAARPPADPPPEFEQPNRSVLQKVQHVLHNHPAIVPVLIFALSLLIFAALTDGRNLSGLAIKITLEQVSIVGILAAAQTLVILTAGIDLSIGAVMVLSYVAMGHLAVTYGVPSPLAVLGGFATGGILGMISGLLVTRVKLPPFIVTLGMWQIVLATVYLYTGSQSIRSQTLDAEAPLLKVFGERVVIGGYPVTILGAPVIWAVVLMVAVFAVLAYVMTQTAWGRHVYAVGDDKEAAELAGVRADATLLSVYVVAGLIAALASWAAIGRVGSISPSSFFEANLDSIAAVVIGGTSLFGGRGTILGSLFGALTVGVFATGLKLAGADPQWVLFASGCLIILAVALDQWIRRISS